MGLPTLYPVGTPYGRDGDWWAAGYHTGEDFLTPVGSTIKNCVPGKVIHAGWGGWGAAYGIHVIIHVTSGSLKGRRIIYAHLKSTAVIKGQTVNYQQVVGKSGNTGNTSGPHLHLEVRVPDKNGNYGYWQHVNPDSVLRWKPVPPAFAYPKKPAIGKKWIKLYSQNCAYNNSHGIKTGHVRFDGLTERMIDGIPDLITCQELPTNWRNKVDKELKNYERMAGNYGRYTYGYKKTVKKIKGKSVTPSTKAGKDVKPYTLLNCKVRGVECLSVNLHLKSGAAWAGHRRKYLREVIPEVIRYADRECGLPKHRIIWSGDFNGYKEIVEEFAKFGIYATYGMAHNRKYAQYKTVNQKKTSVGWEVTTEQGFPIDMIFTTHNRPVSVHNNRRHGYSDHGSTRAIITFAKK